MSEMVDWFHSNINDIKEFGKDLAIYESGANDAAVSTLLRLAIENEVRIG